MTITPEQFTETLRQIVRQETATLATKKQVESLQTSVDGLATKIKTLNEEFPVHRTRLTRVEQELGITPR